MKNSKKFFQQVQKATPKLSKKQLKQIKGGIIFEDIIMN